MSERWGQAGDYHYWHVFDYLPVCLHRKSAVCVRLTCVLSLLGVGSVTLDGYLALPNLALRRGACSRFVTASDLVYVFVP